MSDMPQRPALRWRKSTFSGAQGGNCVEVADVPSGRLVRDSKRPDGPVLRFTADVWASFVAGVRKGDACG